MGRGQTKWPAKNFEILPFVDKGFFETRNVILEKETEILDEFYIDFESTIPSWDISVVRKFFRNYKTVDTESQNQGRAKLDGRCYATKLQRKYPDWLIPAELQHHLGIQVR